MIVKECVQLHVRYQRQNIFFNQMVLCCLGINTLIKETEVESYIKPEQMSAEDLSSEHYKLYYERDVKLAREVTPLLKQLCSTYDFDFVLIDGNEYTGLAEYEIVDQVCQPLYLALHDTGTLKTRRVEQLLALSSDRWSKISSGVDAAGWAVYKSVRW